MDLTPLIEPKSVAVFGASTTKINPGRVLLENYNSIGAAVVAVNPGNNPVPGFKTIKDVSGLAEPVDLAVIAVPKAGVVPTVEKLLQTKKAKAISVISAGFEEFGDRSLASAVIGSSIPVQGSNIAGNICKGFNLTFLNADPAPISGPGLCVISQSGAFLTSIAKELPIRYGFGIGNQSGLTLIDYVQFCCAKNAGTIIIYADKVQADAKAQLIQAARKHPGVQFVLYEGARNSKAMAAAALHSGGQDSEIQEQKTQLPANVTRLTTLQSVVDFCRLLEAGVREQKCLALAQSGFVSTRFASALTKGRLSEKTEETLRKMFQNHNIPAHVTPFLDTTPQASPAVFGEIFDILLKQIKTEPDTAAILCLSILPELFTTKELKHLTDKLTRLSEEDKKKIVIFVESDAHLALKLKQAIPQTFFRADTLEVLVTTTPDAGK